MKNVLKCGASKKTITPPPGFKPLYIAGYNSFDSDIITGVEHDIFVRCIYLEHWNTKLFLLSFDLIGLAFDLIQRIKNAVLKDIGDANIFLYCTHTHAGPDTVGLWGGEMGACGRQEQYEDYITDASVMAALEAKNQAAPAQIHYAHSVYTDEIKNNRPVKVLSGDINIVRFIHYTDGSVLATLLTYTVQPEITSRRNTSISGDYPGILCSKLEEQTKKPVLFVMGASGAMTPYCVETDFDKLYEFSDRLTVEVQKALQCLQTIPAETGIQINTADCWIEVENEQYRQLLSNGMFMRKFENNRISTEVSRISIGSLHIVNFPGEVFPRLTRNLVLPEDGVIMYMTLCNDNIGYLIPADEFDIDNPVWVDGENFAGHEQESLGKNAGKKIIEALNLIAPGHK